MMASPPARIISVMPTARRRMAKQIGELSIRRAILCVLREHYVSPVHADHRPSSQHEARDQNQYRKLIFHDYSSSNQNFNCLGFSERADVGRPIDNGSKAVRVYGPRAAVVRVNDPNPFQVHAPV
jgi:hypothetical protein